MIKHLVATVVMATAVVPAAPVYAQNGGADRVGYRAITARDYVTAERRLVAERRIFPNQPAPMLNLAAVYIRTGRADRARALYAEVLEGPEVAMDMPSGAIASSHAVARTALASMGRTTVIATR